MSKRSLISFFILLLIFLTPVLVYVATFGASLSRSHSIWSEFGSVMSGIYAPIIAMTTLLVLLAQLGLQNNSTLTKPIKLTFIKLDQILSSIALNW